MVNDDVIITALVTNKSIREAAKAAKVSESTIYSRLRDGEFFRAVQFRRIDIMQGVLTAAQESVLEAIDTIREIMHDDNESAKDRLQAAELLINQSRELECRIPSRNSSIQIDSKFDL